MATPRFTINDVAICIDNGTGGVGTEKLTIGKEYMVLDAVYAGFDEHIAITNDAGQRICYWPGRFKKRPIIKSPVYHPMSERNLHEGHGSDN